MKTYPLYINGKEYKIPSSITPKYVKEAYKRYLKAVKEMGEADKRYGEAREKCAEADKKKIKALREYCEAGEKCAEESSRNSEDGGSRRHDF